MRTIMTTLEKIINKHPSRCFNLTYYHANNEFDKEVLKKFLVPSLMHFYVKEDHAGIIKRSTRTTLWKKDSDPPAVSCPSRGSVFW